MDTRTSILECLHMCAKRAPRVYRFSDGDYIFYTRMAIGRSDQVFRVHLSELPPQAAQCQNISEGVRVRSNIDQIVQWFETHLLPEGMLLRSNIHQEGDCSTGDHCTDLLEDCMHYQRTQTHTSVCCTCGKRVICICEPDVNWVNDRCPLHARAILGRGTNA